MTHDAVQRWIGAYADALRTHDAGLVIRCHSGARRDDWWRLRYSPVREPCAVTSSSGVVLRDAQRYVLEVVLPRPDDTDAVGAALRACGGFGCLTGYTHRDFLPVAR